jgi:PAS domain S-box-containing protein
MTPQLAINNFSTDDRGEAVSDVLFDSIGEGAIIIDERGNIARVNKIALDILGYSSDDELIGKWYPMTVIAESEEGHVIPRLERPITEAFLRGEPVSRRLYFRKKAKGRVPVALNVAPIMLDDKPIGAIELFRDITDEMQLEHAKDEFISIASHQLRTPATVVKQNLGMILEGYIDSEDMRSDLIQIAYDHNNTQLEIINNLLKIAQVEASKLTPNFQRVNVITLLESVISSQLTEYKARDIEIKLIAPKKRVMIWADPLHMQMVMENLINNAQKYSAPNTKVSVEVENNSKSATIHVRDQGVGIARKDIAQLFQKFSRLENTDSTASGTGLGLYWAKKLVELHGGEINVASKLHKGTTFSVTISSRES